MNEPHHDSGLVIVVDYEFAAVERLVASGATGVAPRGRVYTLHRVVAEDPLLDTAVEHVIRGAWEINARRSSHPDFTATVGRKLKPLCVRYRRDPGARGLCRISTKLCRWCRGAGSRLQIETLFRANCGLKGHKGAPHTQKQR
jgi:hypothetical protein